MHGLMSNIKINQKKVKLNQLMTNFVKDRSLYLIKHTYFTWKHHYELETYYRKATNEFKQYREQKMLGTCFNMMKVETKKKKKLRDLESTVTEYFSKKIELRLLKISFMSLKKFYSKEIFTKSGKADIVADNHFL